MFNYVKPQSGLDPLGELTTFLLQKLPSKKENTGGDGG